MQDSNLAVIPRCSPEEDLEVARKDAFAMIYATTGVMRSALASGYYDPLDAMRGFALLRDPYVQQKIKEARQFLKESYSFTKADLHAQLAHDREFAYAAGNASAAAQASISQGKVAGLLAEEKAGGTTRIVFLDNPALA